MKWLPVPRVPIWLTVLNASALAEERKSCGVCVHLWYKSNRLAHPRCGSDSVKEEMLTEARSREGGCGLESVPTVFRNYCVEKV